jgi:galactose mutarotase-like enzyme
VPAVELHVWRAEPAVTLRAAQYAATFLPSCGMLCSSLRYRDEEYVAWPRTLDAFRGGVMTAIPLVHPWGNRLDAWEYRVGRTRVDLRGLELSDDGKGLPIHGNLRAAAFDVLRLEPGRLRARFDYGAQPGKLAAFPFPHAVDVDVRLDAGGLRVATAVTPTGRAAVPISFCWHPYVRVPGAPRAEWELRWPRCEHVEVDARVLPTGARTPRAAEHAPLGSRTFDDHYALGRDRRFSLSAGGRGVHLAFDRNYPFAQLYVPRRGEFAAIEPMTATIDALGSGTAPMCPTGSTFRATFRIGCGP